MSSSESLLPPRFFSVKQVPSPERGKGEAGSTRLALGTTHHCELRFPYENGLKGPTLQSGGFENRYVSKPGMALWGKGCS